MFAKPGSEGRQKSEAHFFGSKDLQGKKTDVFFWGGGAILCFFLFFCVLFLVFGVFVCVCFFWFLVCLVISVFLFLFF